MTVSSIGVIMAVHTGKQTDKREVSINGTLYPSVSEAARQLRLPTQTVFSRVYSKSKFWTEWKYVDGNSIPENSKGKYEFLDWVVYQFTHVPSGKVYVGMTGNFRNRKNHHKHLLRQGNHTTPLLQAQYNQDPDWDNWTWTGFILSTKEEAIAMEQTKIDEFEKAGLLLNGSLLGQSPIEYVMAQAENKRRQLEGTRDYIAKNPEKPSENGRKGCEKRWADKSNRQAWKGAGNPFAKKVKIDGVVYGSVKDAVKAVGIGEKTIRTRANSDAHPNYTFDI